MAQRRFGLVVVGVVSVGVGAVVGGVFDGPLFVGAGAGETVEFAPVTLPAVVEGPQNNAYTGTHATAFSPSFDELMGGELLVTSELQFQHIWRRVFSGVPYPSGVVDFDEEFVVWMGGGLTLDTVSFDVTSVEVAEATFETVFFGSQTEQILAVTATMVLPGVAPKEEVFEWKVSAVRVDRDVLGDVIFNRDVVPLP